MKNFRKKLLSMMLVLGMTLGLSWTGSNEQIFGADDSQMPITTSSTATEASGSETSDLTSTDLVGISTEKSTVKVIKGGKTKLSVIYNPSNTTQTGLTFKSSNKKIATVSKSGVVKGKKYGTCKITIKSKVNKSIKTTVKIKVTHAVKKVKVTKSTKYITKGDTFTRKASVSPSNAGIKKITYTSSNRSIATVDTSGKVSGIKVGTATITARATDGSGKTSKYKVTVEKPALSKTSLKLVEGTKYTLEVTGTNRKVTWKSGNTSLATVSKKGVVKAKNPGTVTITATVGSTVLSCKINITNKAVAIGNYEYEFDLDYGLSDITIINGLIYSVMPSADDHSNYNNVNVYSFDEDEDAFLVKTIKHNLGHANTIDYNSTNDSIILGDGSNNTTTPGKVYILNNISNRNKWEYKDCVEIDLSSLNWGYKMQAVWGDEEDTAYIITNDNMNFHKIKLLKTKGAYNGEYEVVGEWTASKSYDVNQGSTYYNGVIYTAVGHSQLRVIANILQADGSIIQYEMKDIQYTKDKQWTINPFPEGIDIENGKLYLGAQNNTSIKTRIRVYDFE